MNKRVTAIIPKTVSVVRHDDDGVRHVDLMDLMDLIDEVAQEAESRKADRGDKGDQGPEGKPGRDGRDGKDGATGKNGRDGIDGADGTEGKPGLDGRDGKDGKDGKPGNAPEHQVEGYRVRFKNPDGSWGAWIEAPKGDRGKSGGVVTVFSDGTNGTSTGGGTWGDIIGALADQTDLQAALDAKASVSSLPTYGTATLDFGAAPGTNVVAVTVTGQADIISGSHVMVWFQGDSTADHNAYEHLHIFPNRVSLTAGDIVAGDGFTIYASTELRLTGTIACRWSWR